MQVYAPDTEAVAVVLSQTSRVKYDFRQEVYPLRDDRHVVIKILKEGGIHEYGNAEINYYTHDNYSKIGDLKAIVHLPDGTQVKVEDSQIFEQKVNDYWSSKRIAFPKIVPGAIIEYQYAVLSRNMFEPVDWFFQRGIPIIYSELTAQIPEWFEYVILTQGIPADNTEKGIQTENIQLSTIARGNTAWEPSKLMSGSYQVKFIHYTFISKDVPALEEECCITTMDDYYGRIRFRLNSFQFPQRPIEPVLNTWPKLAEGLYDITDWGGQFRNKRPGELVLEAAGINPASTSTELETAQKLYDYLNTNFQWNEYYDMGLSKDISTLLKLKSGSSGALNKLMHAALLQAGIPSEPVMVSTREHGKLLELYPFTEQFNHMVVLATLDGKETWIDLGHTYAPLGMLRPNVVNTRGWVVSEDKTEWVNLVPKESKSVYLIKGNIDKEGNLNGELEARFTGYHALNQRTSLSKQKDKFGENLMENTNSSVKLTSIELIDADDVSIPFKLKAKIINQPVATVTPDKIFISAILPQGLDDLPFKLEKRKYPIEMNYPEDISIILDLTVPDGYTIESLPAPVIFITENGGIQVAYNVTQMPGKVNVTLKYIVKQLQFDPAEYSTLREIHNARRQKFTEQIVLSKT